MSSNPDTNLTVLSEPRCGSCGYPLFDGVVAGKRGLWCERCVGEKVEPPPSNPERDNTAFLSTDIAYALLGESPSTSSPGECEQEDCGKPATIHVLGDMDCHVSLYCCDDHVPEWVNHGEFALRRVQSRQFLDSCIGSLAESEYDPFGPDDQIPERPRKVMTAKQMREIDEQDEMRRRGEIVAE